MRIVLSIAGIVAMLLFMLLAQCRLIEAVGTETEYWRTNYQVMEAEATAATRKEEDVRRQRDEAREALNIVLDLERKERGIIKAAGIVVEEGQSGNTN